MKNIFYAKILIFLITVTYTSFASAMEDNMLTDESTPVGIDYSYQQADESESILPEGIDTSTSVSEDENGDIQTGAVLFPQGENDDVNTPTGISVSPNTPEEGEKLSD